MINQTISDLPWRDARRTQALVLKNKGWKQCDIAEALGVSEAAVSKWCKLLSQEGKTPFKSLRSAGAPSKLNDDQKQLIPEFLSHGAEAYGFRGQVWTCARVAKVIEREFGVSYHPDHVSRIIKKLGWTPQKPITRASQRDEQQIMNWRKFIWPTIKKKPICRTE
jgi:transposase